jgi:AcrR family transcriptional regulator
MTNRIRTSSHASALVNPRKEKILNCAEREFSAHGYTATPLRKIAAAAKVNQALIIYYFGSKEKLYQAVFLRRGLELTERRLRMLDEIARKKSGKLTVEDLVRSFLYPAIQMLRQKSDGREFLRLQARLQSEPTAITSKLRAAVYDKATRAYIQRFRAALPRVDAAAIVWRMTMMIGAYLYVISDPARLEQLSDGACDARDYDEMLQQFLSFFAGGFKAPVTAGGTRLLAENNSTAASMRTRAKRRVAET